jgi:TfoX/Sxy family transcriptional regulator of competence genes
MAYDEHLADRVRELLGPQRGLTEKRMFGGLAFLVGGHLAVAVSRQGGLLVRVDPDDADQLVARTTATVAVMGGRTMKGWLRVEATALRTRSQLSKWVARGTAVAQALPAK